MGNIPEEMVIMVGLLMGIYYCKIIDGLQLLQMGIYLKIIDVMVG
jgi:hypothetical protein